MRAAIFLIALFSFFSCKKDVISKSFVGEWQLKEAYGFRYHDEFPPNSGNKIIISSDEFQEFWQGLSEK
jgi:hypothetical protein